MEFYLRSAWIGKKNCNYQQFAKQQFTRNKIALQIQNGVVSSYHKTPQFGSDDIDYFNTLKLFDLNIFSFNYTHVVKAKSVYFHIRSVKGCRQ